MDTERELRSLSIHAVAERFYRDQLMLSSEAHGPCTYLKTRGLAHVLTADSPWQVGFAPARWDALSKHLRHEGFTETDLVDAGVACRTRRGSIVDRFRDRIVLPQRNIGGETVGFVGRAAPAAASDVPKYLNSPRTALYDKGRLLYGLHECHTALAGGQQPVLVEGPLDVLAVAATETHGTMSIPAVTPCGTALTADQVALLRQHMEESCGIVVAYDNDTAGRRAAAAAYELLQPHLLDAASRAMTVTMPAGADPAEVLQVHGPRTLRSLLTEPRHKALLAERAIDTRLAGFAQVLDGAEGRIAAVKAVAPLITTLPTSEVAQQVARVARKVHLDAATVTLALTDAVTGADLTERRLTGLGGGSRTPLRAPPADLCGSTAWRHSL